MSLSASQIAGSGAPKKTNCTFWVCLLLVLATVAAYWPVVHADFINYDDPDYVSNNPRVQNGLTWKGVTWAFTTRHASNWHPLTWLSHMLDVEMFGKGPHGPHTTNLLLHAANSCLLFLALRRLTGALWRCAIVAGLFALHPLHVESVAWISERKDVLSTFFAMLTMLAYGKYAAANRSSPVAGSTRHRFTWYGLALLCFTLGLMSKPMLVTLPCVMLLLDFWPLRRAPGSRFPLLAEKIPFFVLSAASCVVTTWAQKNAIQPLDHLPVSERIANAAVAYASYVQKMFWPENLALPYLHPGHWPAMHVALAAILIVGLSLGAVLAWRRHTFASIGWFWFLGTLVPVIGLVQVGAQSMADRYSYVPLIGLFIVIAWGASELTAWARLPRAVAIALPVALLAVCGGLTRKQAEHWLNGETLFKHSAQVTKDNFIALSNVGGVLFESGRTEEAMVYYQKAYLINPRYVEAVNSIGAVLAARGSGEAVEWFRKALELQPNHPHALFNMGNAMAKSGNSTQAVHYFQTAVRVKPDNFEAWNNLGNALVNLRRFDEAIAAYQSALEYKPDAALIHKNLGEMLAAKGKLDDAIDHYRQTLGLTNDAGAHYSLGLTLAVQGKWDEAIAHYAVTVRLSPTNAEARYNLGYAFRVRGRLAEAADQLGEALRLKPDFALAHFNLACVLADRKERAQAIAHLQETLRLEPNHKGAQEKLRALEIQSP